MFSAIYGQRLSGEVSNANICVNSFGLVCIVTSSQLTTAYLTQFVLITFHWIHFSCRRSAIFRQI